MPDPSEPRGEPTPSVSSKPNSKTIRKRAPDARRLRAQLRIHIERQIARFDAALDAEPPPAGFDSGKVLRDLGGLKNLLDDMNGPNRAAGKGRRMAQPANLPCPWPTSWPCARISRAAMLHSRRRSRTTAFLTRLSTEHLRLLEVDWLHRARHDQLPRRATGRPGR